MSPLPLLSMTTWRSDPALFAAQIRDAARTVGFFLLRHGLPPSVPASALSEARRFFARPDGEKRSIPYEDSGGTFRGYMRLGAENTAGRADFREQVEYGTASPLAEERKRWPPYERLRGPNPWPDAFQPTLRPAVERYVEGALDIAASLREALCLGLGLERSALDDAFDRGAGPYWQLKLVSYPPAVDAAEGEEGEKTSRQGVGAHTDSNFLTLVLQDDAWDDGGSGDGAARRGGLQVFSRSDGGWIDVPSTRGPDVLVCNLGEQAEIVSGGYYRATPHRVVLPEPSSSSSSSSGGAARARTSVPFFYNPDLSATLEALPRPLAERGGDADGRDGGREEERWRTGGRNRMLGTVGENLFKSLARSHPGVFRRYHGDLRVMEDGRIVRAAEEE